MLSVVSSLFTVFITFTIIVLLLLLLQITGTFVKFVVCTAKRD